jgi:hypothetical protein
LVGLLAADEVQGPVRQDGEEEQYRNVRDEFPLTPAGKIQKDGLREIVAAKLGQTAVR